MKAKILPRIHSSEKHDLAKAIPLSTPYSVHIDPCSWCNFRCKFCFQSRKDKPEQNIMGGLLFKKIIDDLCQFPNRIKKVKIGLHGEPTLYPDLSWAIRYLKSKDKVDTIELFTNGVFLSEKIVNSGFDRVNISIEGLSDDEYKKMTGRKIIIKGFIEHLRWLYKNRGDCKFYIKTVTQDKEKFYNMFGDICDEIFVENVVPQWPDTVKKMPKVGMYGQPIKQWKEVCPFPFMYLHYNWDGSVSPCTLDWQHKVIIGDANKESALEIWSGEKLRDLRAKMLQGRRREIDFCDKCLAPMVCCEEDLDDLINRK